MIPCRCGKYVKRMTRVYDEPNTLLEVCNNCGRRPDNKSRSFIICTCSICGYEWQQGKDGSHSCTDTMAKTIKTLEAEIETLRSAQNSSCEG